MIYCIIKFIISLILWEEDQKLTQIDCLYNVFLACTSVLLNSWFWIFWLGGRGILERSSYFFDQLWEQCYTEVGFLADDVKAIAQGVTSIWLKQSNKFYWIKLIKH